MRSLAVAVTQMACVETPSRNIERAVALVEHAAARGAMVVVLQELFETPYFCIGIDAANRALATRLADNPAVRVLQEKAKALKLVIPVSFFERDGEKCFNTLAILDADGSILGCYRKSHIPDFPAYEEAFYFAPGDTGFRVWDTRYVKLGAAVCWDQWFPEAARSMVLMGAELLVYPTAIGRPTEGPAYEVPNSLPHWQRAMQGHAAANTIPVAASNRVGVERGGGYATQFYGGSFIADETGLKVAELGEADGEVAVHDFDLDRIADFRKYWGLFRTRRPDLYGPITGQSPPEYLMKR